MAKQHYSTDELSYHVIGICMEVHREIGPGFPEEYYQRALEFEFAQQNLLFESQKPVQMLYKDVQVGMNYLDFDIKEEVILEIKSVNQLTKTHLFQVLKYLAVARRSMALLVNFGNPSLEYKRIFPTKKIQEHWSKQENHSVIHPSNPNNPL